MSRYAFIRVPRATHHKIKLQATMKGKSIIEYLDELTGDEQAFPPKNRGVWRGPF